MRGNNLKLDNLQNRKQYIAYQNNSISEYKNVIYTWPSTIFNIYKLSLAFHTIIRSYFVWR